MMMITMTFKFVRVCSSVVITVQLNFSVLITCVLQVGLKFIFLFVSLNDVYSRPVNACNTSRKTFVQPCCL